LALEQEMAILVIFHFANEKSRCFLAAVPEIRPIGRQSSRGQLSGQAPFVARRVFAFEKRRGEDRQIGQFRPKLLWLRHFRFEIQGTFRKHTHVGSQTVLLLGDRADNGT
jgi:hypothetical protein